MFFKNKKKIQIMKNLRIIYYITQKKIKIKYLFTKKIIPLFCFAFEKKHIRKYDQVMLYIDWM